MTQRPCSCRESKKTATISLERPSQDIIKRSKVRVGVAKNKWQHYRNRKSSAEDSYSIPSISGHKPRLSLHHYQLGVYVISASAEHNRNHLVHNEGSAMQRRVKTKKIHAMRVY